MGVNHDSSSGGIYSTLPDVVFATHKGQCAGITAMDMVQAQYCDPDELFFQLKIMLPSIRDVEILSVIRGFLRPIQKELERGKQ